LQFRELFRDNLIIELAAHANARALAMVPAIEKLGYLFLTPPCSNQLFPILPNPVIEGLAKKYVFHTWQQIDGRQAAIRLVTSWATPEAACEQFVMDLAMLSVAATHHHP
jgi:threonine aldolase